MQKQDLIIGASTNYDWNKLKYWINSIKMSGFNGDIALILMNCDKETVKKVHDAGVIIIGFVQDAEGNLKHQSGMPIHTERFLHIHNFLSDKIYRYVITTDVKDVIFQRNPIEYLEKNLGEEKNLMFASESSPLTAVGARQCPLHHIGSLPLYSKSIVLSFCRTCETSKSVLRSRQGLC